MTRTYVELHPIGDSSVIFRLGAPITRNDDETPVFAGGVEVLETTNRSDGPFTPGKLYNSQTDEILPAPPLPNPPPLSEAQLLIENLTWDQDNRDNAMRELLKLVS